MYSTHAERLTVLVLAALYGYVLQRVALDITRTILYSVRLLVS